MADSTASAPPPTPPLTPIFSQQQPAPQKEQNKTASSEAGSGYAPGFQQPMPGGLPLPAYSSNAPLYSPVTSPPPSYMPATAGQYAPMEAPGVGSGYAMAYPSGPGCQGQPVTYQPVASGQRQVIVVNVAGPELPVSPHPAAALGKLYEVSTKKNNYNKINFSIIMVRLNVQQYYIRNS